jgi:hypothetical protein
MAHPLKTGQLFGVDMDHVPWVVEEFPCIGLDVF